MYNSTKLLRKCHNKEQLFMVFFFTNYFLINSNNVNGMTEENVTNIMYYVEMVSTLDKRIKWHAKGGREGEGRTW